MITLRRVIKPRQIFYVVGCIATMRLQLCHSLVRSGILLSKSMAENLCVLCVSLCVLGGFIFFNRKERRPACRLPAGRQGRQGDRKARRALWVRGHKVHEEDPSERIHPGGHEEHKALWPLCFVVFVVTICC